MNLPDYSGGGWSFLGIADENGDGTKDLLYHHNSLPLAAAHFMSGTTVGAMGEALIVVPDAVQTLTESNQETDTAISSIGYTLGAGLGNLTLASGAGSLVGTGNSLANTIVGNEGDNRLTGGSGADTLTGGLGADTFVYGVGSSTVGARDTITDFTVGTDLLDLSGLGQFRFLGTGAFDGQANGLRYATSGGMTTVSGDLNGDRTADFAIDLTGTLTLTTGSFATGSLNTSGSHISFGFRHSATNPGYRVLRCHTYWRGDPVLGGSEGRLAALGRAPVARPKRHRSIRAGFNCDTALATR